jgi:glycosyltransferase involved in cell wall biosynthesis
MSYSRPPSISLIVPVYNGGDNFRRCLKSLTAAEPAPNEIIVVADGDTDGSFRLAEEFGLRVLRIPKPGGPAKARNLGARLARGDILFFVDADVTIPRDAISRISASFQQEQDVTAVFGSYDDEPFENNFLSQYKNLFHHYVHQTANADASTFWGACGAIRRDIFLALNGYDENYDRPSIEDIELGYRLKRAGHRIRLIKGLTVKHLKRWGIASMLKADFFYRALPWTELLLKEGRFINDLNLKISSRICVMLTYLLLLTIGAAFALPWLFILAVFIIASLLAINWNTYRFFKAKRGLLFALKVLPWHWFYFFYSGLAFAIGFLKFQVNRLRSGGKGRFDPGEVA